MVPTSLSCSSCVVKPFFATSMSCVQFRGKYFNNKIISRKKCSYVGLQLRREGVLCRAQKNTEQLSEGQKKQILQVALWASEGAYILWLFLLPYAPGDPVWAIKMDTVNDLVDLSLNFFFILPFLNSVGIRLIDSPVLHPVSEGLFNFVIGWTFVFAPLLFTDYRRDRYKGSLDVLWGFQMFLTNAFLIPYMAIRLNDKDVDNSCNKLSKLGTVMTSGAPVVGLIGGVICLISALWAFFGRGDGGFGSVPDRLEFFANYVGSERLAYAFLWDVCLYAIFQPWLIGDNMQNVKEQKVQIVSNLRFIPVVGLVVYLLNLNYAGVERDREN
ncbi:putative transmembrane protein [Cinnamomum micranthum f. kanehirae]|uniref:Putative transmembrane protein n=1 Tax=Cinnamomum micranthum f. kanehirae TaxID=337451 RepID=A0A3S4P810_9MAGN|nr:putative transmembrane protein [Cinnamomum micranthum f. kanehirae]